MDFITAAHELYRRYTYLLRDSSLMRGLYVGMAERELREFMSVQGDDYLIELIETAQHNGGAWEDHAGIMEPCAEEGPSIYHISLWNLVDRFDGVAEQPAMLAA